MSRLSNDQGRAYEMAYLLSFTAVLKLRGCSFYVVENSSFSAVKRAWDTMPENVQATYIASATSAINTLIELEPIIVEDKSDKLELLLQPDNKGKAGDVRDILIVRSGIKWEIGLSVKHNHFAVKHSRLAKTLDFGEKWFGVKCSPQYWADIKPIFDYLQVEKEKGSKWSDLPSKEQDVYIPLLQAFMKELRLSNKNTDNEVPQKMVEYLLGRFDFYKVIGVSNKRVTKIQTFNLRGTLNQSGKKSKPVHIIPVANLPTRIVDICFKPDSTNTVELYLDGGWQFSFRIHNASTKVETSLKFDVQIVGVPLNVVYIECKWG
ncbi:MAG: HaeIII family restriction endonuclease [Defluviitaleaceae bacterium]|nr:HaeIII family restriction endonuclease [Defluviitaleaceae bacterium]